MIRNKKGLRAGKSKASIPGSRFQTSLLKEIRILKLVFRYGGLFTCENEMPLPYPRYVVRSSGIPEIL